MSPRRLLLPLAAAATALTLAGSASAAVPKRIVALTPFTANALAALNVKPIARGDMPGSNDRYLDSVRNIKTLPLSHPNGPNMEQLAVLNPGLVLSSPEWSKGNKTMQQLGMKVVNSDPQRVRDVPMQTEKIADLVDKSALGKTRAGQQARAIAAAKSRAQTHPTVLLILGVGRTPYAFLENSWGGDVIKQAGGRLITKDLQNGGGFQRISNEYVVEQNPDVIIAVPHGTTSSADRDALATALKTNVAWQDTSAMKNGRLYVSANNDLLQASPLVPTVITDVQKQYLKNR